MGMDLLVVAVINLFLTLFGLPWIHGAIPHSPLHARALADFKEVVAKGSDGHTNEVITGVRETRVSAIFAHVLIGLSLFMLPTPLTSIPKPVLDGLFLFVALTSLYGNQFFERLLLLVTEQSAYPPNHYLRRVPQKKIHTFTAIQFIQLLVIAVIGFYPLAYMKMFFPILILLLLPIRQYLIPKIIEKKYLDAFDGAH